MRLCGDGIVGSEIINVEEHDGDCDGDRMSVGTVKLPTTSAMFKHTLCEEVLDYIDQHVVITTSDHTCIMIDVKEYMEHYSNKIKEREDHRDETVTMSYEIPYIGYVKETRDIIKPLHIPITIIVYRLLDGDDALVLTHVILYGKIV